MAATASERVGFRSLSILHVLAPARFGGLERVVCSLAAGQRDSGHEVAVAVVLEAGEVDPHPVVAELRAAGVASYPIVLAARAYAQELREVAALCRSVRADVLHTHGYRMDVLHRRTASRCGIPCVSTAHGFVGGGVKNRLYEFLQQRAYRRFDAVVGVSRLMVDQLAAGGVPAEKLTCVHNRFAVEGEPLPRAQARADLRIPPEAFEIGFVGRVGREKGADVFVAAMERLGNVPWSASIVGDGALRSQLQQRAGQAGLDARIRWHGVVPNAQRILTAFDVVVLSSRTEGTPIVLLEAMAAGVPIIATRVGGIPEMISPEEALLVAPDDPDALAAAIRDVHADPDSARARSRQARLRYDAQCRGRDWTDRYDEVYFRITHPALRRRP